MSVLGKGSKKRSSTWEMDICASVLVKDVSFMDSWTCIYHHFIYIICYIYISHILKLSLPLWKQSMLSVSQQKLPKKKTSNEPTIVATRQVVSNVHRPTQLGKMPPKGKNRRLQLTSASATFLLFLDPIWYVFFCIREKPRKSSILMGMGYDGLGLFDHESENLDQGKPLDS